MTVLNSFLSTPNVSSTDRIDFMEHSNSSDAWDWIYTDDFKFYLIENGYISNYSIAMTPHDGGHLNCSCCQLEPIKNTIIKRRTV